MTLKSFFTSMTKKKKHHLTDDSQYCVCITYIKNHQWLVETDTRDIIIKNLFEMHAEKRETAAADYDTIFLCGNYILFFFPSVSIHIYISFCFFFPAWIRVNCDDHVCIRRVAQKKKTQLHWLKSMYVCVCSIHSCRFNSISTIMGRIIK